MTCHLASSIPFFAGVHVCSFPCPLSVTLSVWKFCPLLPALVIGCQIFIITSQQWDNLWYITRLPLGWWGRTFTKDIYVLVMDIEMTIPESCQHSALCQYRINNWKYRDVHTTWRKVVPTYMRVWNSQKDSVSLKCPVAWIRNASIAVGILTFGHPTWHTVKLYPT